MRTFTLTSTLALFPLWIGITTGLQAQEAAQQQPAKRHRIAVLDFNYAAVSSAPQAVFGKQVDIGNGIAAMLIDRLMKDGTYLLIEPNQVHKVVVAENLSDGDLSNPEPAARIGHRLGVDAVVVGKITEFGRDTGGNSEATAGKPESGKSSSDPGVSRIEVAVAITAEIIDTNTGQVVASAGSRGVSQRSGKNLTGELAGSSRPGAADVDMRSSAFAQTMIGQATTAAVGQLAKELEGESARLPRWAPPPLRGEITDVSAAGVAVNVGSTAGLKVGDEMLVTRVVHVVRERVANTPVGAVEDQVGQLTITSVQEDSAVGRFSGAGKPEVGDRVRPLQ